MFLSFILILKISHFCCSSILHPTPDGERAAVQVFVQSQPTQEALDCGFELGKKDTTQQTTPASSNIKVRQQSEKHSSSLSEVMHCDKQYTGRQQGRQQILDIYCQKPTFKTTPKPCTV